MDALWICYICSAELTEKYHVDGKDYCRKHKPPPRPSVFDEQVRGIVIGGDGPTRYQFWRNGHKLAETDAENDDDAIFWFKTRYPNQYKLGAEMRAFDV